MKHLRVLEDAGVTVTRRSGREKLHHLDPVPIRLVHDRWVSKFAEPWAVALSGLEHELEALTMERVYEIYLKSTPECLWDAITDPEKRRIVHFGVGIETDWTVGSRYEARSRAVPDLLWEGENLEVEPPRRLADGAVGAEDLPRDRRGADHTRIATLRRAAGNAVMGARAARPAAPRSEDHDR